MYNPLLGDPSKLKDKDLEDKILDLTKKYHIAARMGQGAACEQIIIALDMYKTEQYTRHMEATKRLVKKQDNGFDDLINVD